MPNPGRLPISCKSKSACLYSLNLLSGYSKTATVMRQQGPNPARKLNPGILVTLNPNPKLKQGPSKLLLGYLAWLLPAARLPTPNHVKNLSCPALRREKVKSLPMKISRHLVLSLKRETPKNGPKNIIITSLLWGPQNGTLTLGKSTFGHQAFHGSHPCSRYSGPIVPVRCSAF